MKKFEWRQYKEPQAHHWIIVRLLRDHFKNGNSYSYNEDRARTAAWLIKELGGKRVMQMLTELQQEERRS
jgi:hypothetical protein